MRENCVEILHKKGSEDKISETGVFHYVQLAIAIYTQLYLLRRKLLPISYNYCVLPKLTIAKIIQNAFATHFDSLLVEFTR